MLNDQEMLLRLIERAFNVFALLRYDAPGLRFWERVLYVLGHVGPEKERQRETLPLKHPALTVTKMREFLA
jgi:hypothetical protein